ncbi:transposase [Reyranella soli]|uniref:Tc1-like transposase DDE domain-containing protein n=1 Tax=Reyranella soli TaxID=1230389 RepID=A0A512NRL4_9HYPH|nr:hypothetical protein RSO01_87430 [Reyranella soli]
MQAEREAWREAQPELNVGTLVFLDETWLSTNMARRYGRCAKGERLRASILYGHWRTTTFLAGLCHDRLVAPLVLDGPIDGDSFRAYVEQFLAPVLRPGQVVVLDNLSSHKVAGVREAIEAVGARVLYLPALLTRPQPHRAALRQAQSTDEKAAARTLDDLWLVVGQYENALMRSFGLCRQTCRARAFMMQITLYAIGWASTTTPTSFP